MRSPRELFPRLTVHSAVFVLALLCLIESGPGIAAEEFPFLNGGREWLVWHAGKSEIVDPDALKEGFNAYLAAPSILSSAAQARMKLLHQCGSQLGPGVAMPADLGKAFISLQQLASDPLDHGRCRTLLRAVVNASSMLSGEKNPPVSEAALLRQKEILTWNLRIEQKQQQRRLEDLGPMPPERPRIRRKTEAAAVCRVGPPRSTEQKVGRRSHSLWRGRPTRSRPVSRPCPTFSLR